MKVQSSIKSTHSTELSAVMFSYTKHSTAMIDVANVSDRNR